jgi:hypothetical protein
MRHQQTNPVREHPPVAQPQREDPDRALWMAVRQGLLLIVGGIEKRYNIRRDPRD